MIFMKHLFSARLTKIKLKYITSPNKLCFYLYFVVFVSKIFNIVKTPCTFKALLHVFLVKKSFSKELPLCLRYLTSSSQLVIVLLFFIFFSFFTFPTLLILFYWFILCFHHRILDSPNLFVCIGWSSRKSIMPCTSFLYLSDVFVGQYYDESFYNIILHRIPIKIAVHNLDIPHEFQFVRLSAWLFFLDMIRFLNPHFVFLPSDSVLLLYQ